MAKNDPAGTFSTRLRKLRRAKRGFVFPADMGEVATPRDRSHRLPAEGHSMHRRRKHRRGTLAGWELFLGFCVVWMALVSMVVALELGSESEWFFVEYGVVNAIDQGTWIIGDKAYMPDGRVMQLEQRTAGLSEGRDVTDMLGKGPHGRSLKWARIAGTLFSLPMVVLFMRLLYRRWVRARLDGSP